MRFIESSTRVYGLVLLLGLGLPLCSAAQTFTDVSQRLNYQDGSLHGAWGASFADVDGNGSPDIYEPGSLYLQQPDGTYASSLVALGIPITKSSVFGSVFADVDDDGFPEMFTIDLNTGRSIFYKNHRGIILADSTESAGFIGLQQGQGTVFADFNGDFTLDMFMGEETGKNQLFFGDGTGSFVEGTADAGIFTEVRSYGVSSVDFDNDGDMDVFVAACAPLSRELSINKFFRNNGDGTFSEIGEEAGVNDDLSSWGIVWLDYDRDGDMDTYIVNMVEADGRAGFNVLYRNNGDGTFTNVAEQTGTQGQYFSFSYGTSAADFNNDGWVDLYVSNRAAPPYLFINNGDGTFTDQFLTSNIPLITSNTSVAVADINSDGWLDIFTGGDFLPTPSNPTYRGSVLLENDGGTNGYLTIRLIQPAPNKRGIGARIEVWENGQVQLRDITAGDGFTSQNMDFSAHFGLGTATAIDSLVVKWPDASRDTFFNVQANLNLAIEKGGTLNNPPTPFKTLQIVSSAQAGKATAMFAWTDAVDPEGQPVTYVVTVKSSEGEIVFESEPTENTLLNASFDIDRAMYEYWWVVTASDGLNIRRSENVAHSLFVIGDHTESVVQPDHFSIETIYPNPVRSEVNLRIIKQKPDFLSVSLIDMLGRSVPLMPSSFHAAGEETFTLELGSFVSGTYTLHVTYGDEHSFKQLVLVR